MTQLAGRLWRLNAEGYILNDASVEQIQPAYTALVNEAVEICTAQIGADIDSLYISGSVARGMAVEGVSDLNVLVVLDAASDPDLVLRDWIPEAEAALMEKYPLVRDVHIELWPYYNVFTDPARFSIGAFILKTHSACVWGVDLHTQLPDYRITPAIANDDLIHLEDDLADAADALAEETGPETVRSWCRFAAKAALWSAFGLVQIQAGVHTRDADVCAAYFAEYHPEYADAAQAALRYVSEPTADADAALALVDSLRAWLLPLAEAWLDQHNPDRDDALPVDDVEERE